MYSILVLECGIAPDYVLDRMEFYEIETLLENKWRKDKESWEQARLQAYFTAQCQSTKEIDPKKIIPFPWDRVKVVEPEDTPEEREAVRKEMLEMERLMNKENNT